ncbi:pre-mRNA-splicing factor CWC22 homolog isoform X2 [Myzus persicae]|nr:pre-mRNA-splicing factor CWC22 homolog isoform X2 [Myzus persicae]
MECPSTSSYTSSDEEYEGSETSSDDIDEQGIIDKSRDVYQRTAWNKLHVAVFYLVYKVNGVNIGTVQKELLQLNMKRANNMFSQLIIQKQLTSTKDTHVYATLISVINLVLPEVGELVLKRCYKNFKSSYFSNVVSDCIASTMFIGHLVNHGVADEKVAVELLTIFFHCGDSLAIKIAIVILEVCGKKLSQIHEDTLNVVFDRVCKLLNNEELYEEDANELKKILKLQKNGFKFQQFDLVPANECQVAHCVSIHSILSTKSNKIGYRYDPEFELNEEMYKNLVLTLQGYDNEEESELESVNDFNNQFDGEKELIEVMKYINDIEKDKNMLSLKKMCLKKVISLINSMNCAELVPKIAKHCQGDMDLYFSLLDICCEQATYEPKYGLITKEFCCLNKSFADMIKITFIYCYVTSDSFASNRAEIIAKYFAHIAYLNLIPCPLSVLLRGRSIYPKHSYSKMFNQELNNRRKNWKKKI